MPPIPGRSYLPTESDPLRIVEGDCLDVLRTLPDGCVDAVVTDPPFHRVKGEAWDRQWGTDADYLRWLRRVRDQWHRVLKPNGSLYCFASPRMAARVEVLIGGRFNVLNSIVWHKPAANCDRRHAAQVIERGVARSWFPNTERIVFAEHYGADSMAKGEAGYAAKCDELRGFVFEPLRAYLDGERQAAGLTPEQVNVICGFREQGGMAGRHWFSASQFAMPTALAYAAVAAATGRFQRPHEELRREYEELRREYEELRREYEELRRPFAVSADVPYTDVWAFPTVQSYPGKHPCEKPLSLMRHIVTASTRPGALILDPFGGSGTTGVAAVAEGRRCLLIEKAPAYAAIARRRVAEAMRTSTDPNH